MSGALHVDLVPTHPFQVGEHDHRSEGPGLGGSDRPTDIPEPPGLPLAGQELGGSLPTRPPHLTPPALALQGRPYTIHQPGVLAWRLSLQDTRQDARGGQFGVSIPPKPSLQVPSVGCHGSSQDRPLSIPLLPSSGCSPSLGPMGPGDAVMSPRVQDIALGPVISPHGAQTFANSSSDALVGVSPRNQEHPAALHSLRALEVGSPKSVPPGCSHGVFRATLPPEAQGRIRSLPLPASGVGQPSLAQGCAPWLSASRMALPSPTSMWSPPTSLLQGHR